MEFTAIFFQQLQEADSGEKSHAFSNVADLYEVMEQSGCDLPLKVFVMPLLFCSLLHYNVRKENKNS